MDDKLNINIFLHFFEILIFFGGKVDGKVISQIGQGICVLVGISRDDVEKDSDWMHVCFYYYFYLLIYYKLNHKS